MANYVNNKRCGSWASTSMYVTVSGNASGTRSGNTITLGNMKSVFSAYQGSGSDSGFWSAIYKGGTQLKRVTGLTMSGGSGTHNYGNVKFTVGTSDTTATLQFRSSEGNSYYYSFDVSFPTGATVPSTPTISLVETAAGSITISYGTNSFGTAGSGTVKLYMSENSGFSGETEVASKTTTGQSSVIITGLSHRKNYYFRARATSSVGNSSYSNSVGPVTPNPAVKIYGSANGNTMMITKPYGSVNGNTKQITKIYGSVNGLSKLIYN